ncbi:hypothetical protein TSAR_014064 [Trichomalopsis sarcophagae]|uniref:Uncharacterized protein n=1 Tax=Trichomalopsis sarcophagae TaxID=543379 RepID=A0A232FML1_9HYME|nr:hypothetical protein TSAR_014064 [Trichomalopsis sarcophagae]
MGACANFYRNTERKLSEIAKRTFSVEKMLWIKEQSLFRTSVCHYVIQKTTYFRSITPCSSPHSSSKATQTLQPEKSPSRSSHPEPISPARRSLNSNI